jgi:hypothetical protein
MEQLGPQGGGTQGKDTFSTSICNLNICMYVEEGERSQQLAAEFRISEFHSLNTRAD